MNESFDAIVRSFDALWLEMSAFLPRLAVALVLLIGG